MCQKLSALWRRSEREFYFHFVKNRNLCWGFCLWWPIKGMRAKSSSCGRSFHKEIKRLRSETNRIQDRPKRWQSYFHQKHCIVFFPFFPFFLILFSRFWDLVIIACWSMVTHLCTLTSPNLKEIIIITHIHTHTTPPHYTTPHHTTPHHTTTQHHITS